jgi:hypothetical protein
MTEPAALPPRTRLLHIGPPKTGTTALQEAAAASRRQLLQHGVRYPGTGVDHGMAMAAFLGQRWGWKGDGGGIPPMSRWFDLLAEVRSDTRNRVLLGHEYVAKADAETIARLTDAIGGPVHVVVTLRPFASMLPSTWQESLKLGGVSTFDSWLHRVLEKPGPRGADHPARNQGLLVERWAQVVGSQHLTVVALDRARPEQLFSAFEGLLGLPAGLLRAAAETSAGNRGLTAPEAEFLRRLNTAVRDDGVRWDDYADYVGGAAIGRVVRDRVPPASEERLALPAWAAERANAIAAGYVETIRAAGVGVIGDLDALAAPVGGLARAVAPAAVPIDVAVTAVRGTIRTATRREPDEDTGPIDGREYLIVRHVGVGGLLGVVAARIRRRGRKAVRLLPALAIDAVRRPGQRAKRRRQATGDARPAAASR